MAQFSNNILLDILRLCILSITIAIPLFGYARKYYPKSTSNYFGNISTSTFNKLDLAGISLATSLFTLNIIALAYQPSLTENTTNDVDNLSLLLNGLISQLIPVAIACAFLLPRMNISEIFGLRLPDHFFGIKLSPLLAFIMVILSGIVGLIAIYICLARFLPIITPFLENNLGEQKLQAPVQMIIDAKENNPSLLVILAFLAVIVAPICEEFVFRGYLYGVLKRFSCTFFATFISALFFAVVHGNLWSLFPLFIVGLFLVIVYEISGSLWAPILTHMLFNGITTCHLIFGNAPEL